MVCRLWPSMPGLRALDRLDKSLLAHPGFRNWSRYVLLYAAPVG
jgi:hypothetical protein